MKMVMILSTVGPFMKMVNNMIKCTNCNNTETYVKLYKCTYPVKGIPIEVESNRRFCKKCNNLVFDEVLDNETLLKAFKIYSQKYGIDPGKIIELRKNLGLSQSLFSKIIGCARKTLVSYEKGTSIPNDNFQIILKMLLNDPSTINNLILANEENFNESERKIIKNKIGNSSSIDFFNLIFKNNDSLTEFNGYTKVNIEKVEEMVYVLSDTEISKTKLLKEMFYSDFLFYRDTGKSITGLEYIKLQHGPVPDKFSFLIDFCYSENVIDYKVNLYKDREYNAITSKELKVTKLSNEELEIINKVKKYFKNYTAEEIADYSHKEKAYINPKYKERISYDYAFDIDLK